nr:DDE-type integrase/transposase/recombinase [Piscirickettsia salmonis]
MKTLVKIKGRWYYLYRAIDKYGHTLDGCSVVSKMLKRPCAFQKGNSPTLCEITACCECR